MQVHPKFVEHDKQGRSSHCSMTVEHGQDLICACPTRKVEHAQTPDGAGCNDALPATKGRWSPAMTEDHSQAAADDLAKRLRLSLIHI